MLKRLMSVALILVILMATFAVSKPAPVQAQTGCSTVVASGVMNGASNPFIYVNPFLGSFNPGDQLLFEVNSDVPLVAVVFMWQAFTVPVSGDQVFVIDPAGFYSASHTFSLSNSSVGASLTATATLTVAIQVQGLSSPPVGTFRISKVNNCGQGINDGRLCLWPDFAVYTTSDNLDVYSIVNDRGVFVVRVTQEELDANPGTPDTNTLIKEQGRVKIYRLGDSDTLEVHVGPYVQGLSKFVRFTGLPAKDATCNILQ